MLKSSKSISLILIGSVIVFFSFKSCVDSDGSATTRSSSGHGSHWWGGSWGRGSSSSHSSVSHGTSRGGFGSTGHASGS